MAAIAQFTSVKPTRDQWTAMETRIEEYHADQPNATEEQNAFVKKVFLNEDGNFISDARFLLLNVRDAMSEKLALKVTGNCSFSMHSLCKIGWRTWLNNSEKSSIGWATNKIIYI